MHVRLRAVEEAVSFSLVLTASAHPVCISLASAWTTGSRQYNRPSGFSRVHYYETFQVTVPVSGTYALTSKSAVDSYGCLYNNSFSREFLENNRIQCDDDGGDGMSFRIEALLESDASYILLATTYQPTTVGEYTLSVCGLNRATIVSADNTSTVIDINVTTIGDKNAELQFHVRLIFFFDQLQDLTRRQ